MHSLLFLRENCIPFNGKIYLKRMITMNKIVDLDKEIKRRERKEKMNRKIHDICEWIDDNKDLLIVAIPVASVALKGGISIGKNITRSVYLNKEKAIKDKIIYDRSLGKYLELKRPLKNADMKAILARRDNGEKLCNILMDMKLLK